MLNCDNVRGKLFYNHSLARYTSWKIGGSADIVFIPFDVTDLVNFIKQLPRDYPLMCLGLGSNILVSDAGVRGAVIIFQGSGLNKISQHDQKIVADSGVACGQFSRWCARLGFTGMEFLAGIPGTIGGALAMNAGCYNGETWDIVSQVQTIDREGVCHQRDKSFFDIAYRCVSGVDGEIFLSAEFSLSVGEKHQALSEIKALIEKRNASQPTNLPNCGSVFRNPDGDFAARLIESCALKGYRVGGAKVSNKHANFIVNDNHACAADVLAIVNHVYQTVLNTSGIALHKEMKLMGDF